MVITYLGLLTPNYGESHNCPDRRRGARSFSLEAVLGDCCAVVSAVPTSGFIWLSVLGLEFVAP